MIFQKLCVLKTNTVTAEFRGKLTVDMFAMAWGIKRRWTTYSTVYLKKKLAGQCQRIKLEKSSSDNSTLFILS